MTVFTLLVFSVGFVLSFKTSAGRSLENIVYLLFVFFVVREKHAEFNTARSKIESLLGDYLRLFCLIQSLKNKTSHALMIG